MILNLKNMEMAQFCPQPDFLHSSPPYICLPKTKIIAIEAQYLTKPIDTMLSDKILKRLNGFSRFIENEIVLPRHVFVTLGLS